MPNLDFEIGKKEVDAELEKLFANAQTDFSMPVELPTRGKFYKHFKGVKVKPLLFEDEQRIFSMKNANLNPVDEIISKCTEGIDINDLISMDKIYLLLKIKEISYGPEYNFAVNCPKCNQINEVCIDISKDILINEVPLELEDPREVHLPVLDVYAKVRFPRASDENYTSDYETLADNMYRFVVSLNDNENIIFISKAIKKMHIRDRKVLLNEINKTDLGVDPRFQFVCAGCSHKDIRGIPFTANFFSVN